MRRNYDLLAIDLDGTLLNSAREVSPEDLEALHRARAEELQVAISTGRGLVECDSILAAIQQRDPCILAGGSMVGCPITRSTLHRFPLDPALVARATDRLLAHNHPVMVLKDPAPCGYDYLMITGDEEQNLSLDPVTLWWLEHMQVKHRFAPRIEHDEHPDHTVRLGVCGLSSALDQIIADLQSAFGDHATMHHFAAVVAPEHARNLPSGERLHILEVFAKDASKWSALRWLAASKDIPLERTAAIGDEINDLPMIASAACGIAMANAIPAIKQAAKRHTRSNNESGVAHAIHQILDGAW
jgi:hydroxymethylpyrimidine pyrophosphatase-like HAD family hydrolase